MFSNSKNLPAVLFLFLIATCGTLQGQNKSEKNYDKSFEVGAMEAFCEMVNYDVKNLGLGVPLVPDEMDRFLPYAEKSAKRHNVLIYRESDLIDTDLFTKGIAKGRDVLLIYNGTTLTQYLDLKADRKNLEAKNLYHGKAREEIARRFGRLLSYTPRTINNQLALHTDFRTMHNFGIRASSLTFYYKDLGKATRFYTQTLGLKLVEDNNTSKIIQLADDSFLTLVDADIEEQLANEAKTVALALVTEQLEEWYKYLEN